MKLESTISKLLANKTVLYVVSIIATLNIIGYIFYGNLTAVLYFIILALLVSYFSKNMIVILLTPLIFVNLFVNGQQQLRNVEGMENNDTKTADTTPVQTATTTPVNDQSQNEEPLMSSTSTEMDVSPSSSESFKNKKSNNKLDYAGTLKDTYESLNQFLNKEGMEALTNDTKALMEEQKKLAETMQGLGPIIQSFGPMMENMKGIMGGMNSGEGGLGNMENIQGMMKTLSGILPKSAANVSSNVE